jgi:hypothetical protein
MKECVSLTTCAKPSYGAMVDAFKSWAESHPQEANSNRILGVMKHSARTGPVKRVSGCAG